jgi:hypothetical protein
MRGSWSRYINKRRLAIATGFLLREIFEDFEKLDIVFIQWIRRKYSKAPAIPMISTRMISTHGREEDLLEINQATFGGLLRPHQQQLQGLVGLNWGYAALPHESGKM